jgi:hypothetical protein
VDARKEPITFAIHRRGPKGFVAVRKSGGWLASPTLGKSFRFAETDGSFGKKDYTLEVR